MMIRTIKIKLNLSENDIRILKETQKISSSIFNDHVKWYFENKTFSKKKVHKELYDIEREKYPTIPSALIQTLRDTAFEAIKSCKAKFKPKKSETSALRYDKRLFSLRGSQLTISSIESRIKTIISFPDWCKETVENGKVKSFQLCYDKKTKSYFGHFVFDLGREILKKSGNVVGIDRGLVNVVSTSEGELYNSKKIKCNQRKFLFLRKRLSVKGTRSSKRLEKKISGKEKRFNREQNHILSKKLSEQKNVKIYVLENLHGIRKQKSKGRKFNKMLSSWTFSQLEMFVTYKCLAKGILVIKVDPKYTSQRCSNCGAIHKENRCRGKFKCIECGFKYHSDINAAKNIRDRLITNWENPISSKKSSQRSRGTDLNVVQGAVKHLTNDEKSKSHHETSDVQGHRPESRSDRVPCAVPI